MAVANNRIRLHSIERKNGNTFVYHYEMGKKFSRLLAAEPLWVRYEGTVEDIPPGIAAIPFVGMMAPLARFYGGTVEIPRLDEVYADSMARIADVFAGFYPGLQLSGELQVGQRTTSSFRTGDRCAQFFTGGIDSIATVLSHQAENPLLVSIWGADVRLHQEKIWRRVNEGQAEIARFLGLQRSVIASNFFDVLQLWALDVYFPGKLDRGWYVEVGYGSIFLGLAAPLAWREGIGTVYFASSFFEEGHALDGSHPLLVETIAWPGVRVVYDGIRETRQLKVERISRQFCRPNPGLKLLICTKPLEQGNCSVCEKCSRTMSGLALNGIDPARHGFTVTADTPGRIRRALEQSEWEMAFSTFWREIQDRIPYCRQEALPAWQDFFAWLETADLDQFIRNRPKPLWENERRIIKSHLPVPFMRWLRKMKFRLLKPEEADGS